MNDWGERFVGCETHPNSLRAPQLAGAGCPHPLTTRVSSNLRFTVINPLASPNLGGTSCASDRVGWPNLSFPRTRRQAGSGSAQSLRARHAHAPGPRAIFFFLVQRSIEPRPRAPLRGLRGDPGRRPSRWPTPAETQRRELRGELLR